MKRQKKVWPLWIIVLGFILLLTLPLLFSFLIFLYILIPLGIADLPEPLVFLIFILLTISIYWLAIYRLIYLPTKPSSQETSRDRSFTQLKNLNEARKTLAASLKHLDKLSGAIQDSQKKQEELTLLVESLKKASHESASDLKKKIAAIDFVNRRKEFLRYILVFVLGFIVSLMATYIWSLLSTK